MPPNLTTLGSSDRISPATVSTHTPSSPPLTTDVNVNSDGSKSNSMVNEPTCAAPLLTYTLICTVPPVEMASSELKRLIRLEAVAKSASIPLAARLLYTATVLATDAFATARTVSDTVVG